MLSPELLSQIKHIQLKTHRMVNELLQGSYHSAFKGQGMEFDQVREYEQGDDVRMIDWNVSARMDAPYVKQFIEEREMTVVLIVDISASGVFGSQARLKRETAAEFAAVIAYSALKNKDKIGLVLISEEVESYIPPLKGKSHVWRVIREILTYQPKNKGTNLIAGLNYLNKVVQRKAVVFLISDFLTDPLEKELRLTNQHHDVIAVPIVDPRERNLPDVGIVNLKDAETGQAVRIDTSHPKVRQRYQRQRQDVETRWQDCFKRLGLDTLWVNTNEPYIIPLIRLFEQRSRRR